VTTAIDGNHNLYQPLKMTSDQNNSRLPVRQDSEDAQIQPDTDAQAVMGFLPPTGTIDAEERIPMAREEGYDPLAIKLALERPASSAGDNLRLFIFVVLAHSERITDTGKHSSKTLAKGAGGN